MVDLGNRCWPNNVNSRSTHPLTLKVSCYQLCDEHKSSTIGKCTKNNLSTSTVLDVWFWMFFWGGQFNGQRYDRKEILWMGQTCTSGCLVFVKILIFKHIQEPLWQSCWKKKKNIPGVQMKPKSLRFKRNSPRTLSHWQPPWHHHKVSAFSEKGITP